MYQTISADITTFDGDIIVNSLGAGERIELPGQLYRSILRSCDDPKALMEEVTRIGKNLDFGEVYLTDSYGLPCKKILHVVTPFRRFDPGHSKIAKTYEAILELALKSGLKSISVPPIGTGANGYDSDKVALIAQRICYRFSLEHPELDIYFNVYSVEHREEEMFSNRRSRRHYEGEPRIFGHSNACKSSSSDEDEEEEEYEDLEGEPGACYESHADSLLPEGGLDEGESLSLMEEVGLEDEDSFATFVRKLVFARTPGDKRTKELALEDTWFNINAMVGNVKNEKQEKDLTHDANLIAASQIGGEALKKVLSPAPKSSHAPEYEWKKQKVNGKNKGGKYVWQRPNKAEILLAAIALHLTPEETLEVYEFCGFSLSKYEMHERAFRKCVAKIKYPNPWTVIVKEYCFYTSESIYDYKEERKKIYADRGEKW